MTENEADRLPGAEQGEDGSIGELFARLVDDAESFVRTEVKLYRAEALHRLESYKWLFLMGAVGALLGLCTVILLLMALVFALAPYTGTAWAAVIIAALSLTAAAALFIAIFAEIRDESTDDGEGSL